MDFYSVWAEMRKNRIDDGAAITAFLSRSEQSVHPLLSGGESECSKAFSILDSIPIEQFFEVAGSMPIERALIPADVPCFSSFENGASRLNELLEF